MIRERLILRLSGIKIPAKITTMHRWIVVAGGTMRASASPHKGNRFIRWDSYPFGNASAGVSHAVVNHSYVQ